MAEYDNNLLKFFNANIKPSFVEFGWSMQEIAALRGAFFLGAKFTADNITDLDDITDEVERFQASVEPLSNTH